MSIIVGLLKKNAQRTTWYGKWKNLERDHLLTSSEAKTTDIRQQLSHVILFSYKPENEHRSFVGGKKIHPLHVLSSGTSIAPCSIGSCMNLASIQLSIALVSWTSMVKHFDFDMRQSKWMERGHDHSNNEKLLWRDCTCEWINIPRRIPWSNEGCGYCDQGHAKSCIFVGHHNALRVKKRWASFNLQWQLEPPAEGQSWSICRL